MMRSTSRRLRSCRSYVFALGILVSLAPHAQAASPPSIAVLPFESRNLTPLADDEEDVRHVASIGPMLEQVLRENFDLRIVAIDPTAMRAADVAVGYLFEHSDDAARLGLAHDADWILVGRVHKPSFLFSYLMARLVDSHTGELIEDLIVEIKGQRDVVTRRGVERLAEKIAARVGGKKRGR